MENQSELEELLSGVYTDILMLQDGTWQPDEHSCQATIEAIEKIANELNLELKDTRDGKTI